MNSFPVVVGHVWKLRRFEFDDLPLIEEASNDDLIPWITSVPSTFTQSQGEEYIRRQWSRYDQGVGYSFAIARIDTNQACGSLYIDMKDADEERSTIGYWIVKSSRGVGAAKAAVQMVTDFAKNDLFIARVQLVVEPWNIGSIKTAEASGFRTEGIVRGWRAIRGERKDFLMMANVVTIDSAE